MHQPKPEARDRAGRPRLTVLVECIRRLDPARRSGQSRESGQALVEFALVLPFLLMVIFLAIDFGKAFHYWQDETHLANLGARLAAVDQNPGGGSLQSYIQSQADTPELRTGGTDQVASGAKVCITPGSAAGDPVAVTVETNYKLLPILGGVNIPLKGTATMRMERPATKYSAGCSS